MVIRCVGLEQLSMEEQELFKEWAIWDSVLASSPEDFDYQRAEELIRRTLIRRGISPFYDVTSDVYTYIRR